MSSRFVIFVEVRFDDRLMRLIRYLYIILLYTFVVGGGAWSAQAQSRKKRPAQSKTVPKSNGATRKTGSKQKTAQRTSASRYSRKSKRGAMQPSKTKNTRRTISFDAVREERRHLDSLRLHNGGTRTLAAREELLPVEVEPLMMRWRQGDTTLRSETISRLYYSHHAKRGRGSFLHKIETDADASIAASRYGEALRTVRRGLLRSPMHFALLKRACDLAQHEGDPEVDTFLWQIVELFVVVEGSGDGKTPKTAFEVMGVSDAILFETLWMETPKDEIRRRDPVQEEGGQQLLVLELGSGEKKTLRHYRMPGPQ